MQFSAKEIYTLEKELISKKRIFSKITPRPIKIVDTPRFAGMAGERFLLVSKQFLSECKSKDELKKLLLHELIHYLLPKEFHSEKFIKTAEKIGLKLTESEWGQIWNDLRLEGKLKEVLNKDGSVSFIIKRKPNWELFKEDIFYRLKNQGMLFKRLRESYGLSRKTVAKKAGISVYLLSRIEGTKSLVYYADYGVLRKVFYGITNAG